MRRTPGQRRFAYLQRYLSFVPVEQSQTTQILSELALDANLNQIVLEQNAIVFEQESETWKSNELKAIQRVGRMTDDGKYFLELFWTVDCWL